MRKVFAGECDAVQITCPNCDKQKAFDFSKYRRIKRALKLNCKCSCGHTYPVLLERRVFERREVYLTGKFEVPEKGIKGMMTVVDLSRSGLKIEMNVEHDVMPGDKIRVMFRLNDVSRSYINRLVVAREVKGHLVGLEFGSIDHHDKLGAYILFALGVGDKNQ